MGRTLADESLAFEYRPGPGRVISAPRRRIERAVVIGAAAGLICIVPSFLLYMARHFALMPGGLWAQLLVETTTFSMFAGVVHCGAIAAGFSIGGGGIRRTTGAVIAGALSGGVVAALGCVHFGQKATPYFGATTIYVTVALGVLVMAIGLARSEATESTWQLALRCALLPLPLILISAGALALLAPQLVQLDFETLHRFAQRAGLAVMGGLGGALGGALIGAWTGAGAALARRSEFKPSRGST